MISSIEESCRFIENGRMKGNVVVHCRGAISRSPAIALSYLCYCEMSILSAAEQLSEVVRTRPNELFLRQIMVHFGEKVDERKLSILRQILSGTEDSAYSQ